MEKILLKSEKYMKLRKHLCQFFLIIVILFVSCNETVGISKEADSINENSAKTEKEDEKKEIESENKDTENKSIFFLGTRWERERSLEYHAIEFSSDGNHLKEYTSKTSKSYFCSIDEKRKKFMTPIPKKLFLNMKS